jgi:histidinol dehydrogenase
MPFYGSKPVAIPILDAVKDVAQIDALRAKLSLTPLLLQGLDEEDGQSKYEVVRRILRDVREHGDAAVLKFTEQFDHVALRPEQMRVPQDQIDRAVKAASAPFLHALDVAIANIRAYQQAMLPADPPPMPVAGGGPAAYLGLRYTPLERVGLYVPGGAAAYPSSVLMTAIPAQVAGVKGLVLCSPMRDGQVSPAVLAAAAKVGITEIYAIGGAQSIAALAFGTKTIRAVDKIVGPGNTFVQLAKKELYGIVDIDSFAGPSEVVVLADDSADPAQVAAELLAQAEHAPGSCLLITASRALATAVQQQLETQLKSLTRETLTRQALTFASALIITPTHDAALALTDRFAPEHLQITTRDADADAARISHAGAIFIGPYTPVAAGDYLAGPSHVLPTSGTARFFSGLSAEAFRKRTSLIKFDRQALDTVAQSIIDFATVEGFDAHAKSVAIRAQH